ISGSRRGSRLGSPCLPHGNFAPSLFPQKIFRVRVSIQGGIRWDPDFMGIFDSPRLVGNLK
ncbi:hypothetical protein PIB30_013282, partial [Stylosanthes scabra]|nr:hypothetical protein [Stylosanthes scabra]